MNVSIEFESKSSSKTLFKNQKVQYDKEGGILLAPLLERIKESGYSLAHHVVSYYSHSDGANVHVGKDPISGTFSIQPNELDPKSPLAIILKPSPNL